MKVWIVTGWFGDREWIEGVYATLESAEWATARLWETRTSDQTPEPAKGVAKYDFCSWPVDP